MTLTTDYILGLILTVGADACLCMPSIKAEDGIPVKYPEIAYAVSSTCDAMCNEIAGVMMDDTPRDSRELVCDIIENIFKTSLENMKRDQSLDIETIPTIIRGLRVGQIEVSDDVCH